MNLTAFISRPSLRFNLLIHFTLLCVCVRVRVISLTQHRTFRLLFYLIHSFPLSLLKGQYSGPLFLCDITLCLLPISLYISLCLPCILLIVLISVSGLCLVSPQFVFSVFFSDDLSYFNALASLYLIALQSPSFFLNAPLSYVCKLTCATHIPLGFYRYLEFKMLKTKLISPPVIFISALSHKKQIWMSSLSLLISYHTYLASFIS